ncbi:MAG TPA: glycosyltransferase [Candidatus Saccharimonadales bacterium]|nr:glycosyltransferase [Candidatus Saccharimonadales bacterium]
MRLKTAHQFAPTLAYGDAVGNDCFELQRLYWSRGVGSDLFAAEAKPEVAQFARPSADLEQVPVEGTSLQVHISMGNDALWDVAKLPHRKTVVYHNITPAHFFEGLNEHARRYSEIGRQQLAEFARVSELGIADSRYNQKELVRAGFDRTAVVPIIVDWSAFDVAPDPAILRELSDERTDILAVGQILPQKAVHTVVAAFAKYRESDPTARLWLVGSHAMSGSYLGQVREAIRARGLEDAVTLTGTVPMSALVAYYRGATAFVTLSEHEGFCVPLLEAMRAGLPVVASDAGAIPDTLGDAGILLSGTDPDTVAAALERIVRDAALRKDVIARGHRHLLAFTPEAVADDLDRALALAGWELPAYRARELAVVSSDRRSGIHHYALAVCDGLRAAGHRATFVGTKHLDAADLAQKLRYVAKGTDAVIFEHEAGIYSDIPFVRALARLRLRGIPSVVSMHEIEPEKFHHYRKLSHALHYRPSYAWYLEWVRALSVALRIAVWFLAYRAILALMGWLPARILVHSHRSNFWVGLLTRDARKRDLVPLVVMPLEDTTLPKDAAEKRALRERLGLPQDAFVFVSPGFFFKRKRYIEVIEALPDDAVLVLSGTESQWERGYFQEVAAVAAAHPNVILNTDYETMGQYVVASDCVVLFYEDVFQSAVVTQAIWAGLPCIFSDTPGFRLYEGAGLVARDTAQLARAMREIQRPERYASCVRQVGILRRLLSPERNAMRYLIGL